MTQHDESARRRLTTEASEWFAAMQSPQVSGGERSQFLEWLGESSRHVEEYLAISALWRTLDQTDDSRLSTEDLISAARGASDTTNVVTLHSEVSDGARSGAEAKRQPFIPLRRFAVAFGLVTLAVGAWFAADQWLNGRHYSTDVGEQVSFTLADGSIVRLNTQSAIRVRLTDSARHVALTAGEAMFQVAKDPARAFRVHAGDTTVEALGTVFNVYRGTRETTVTVLEGRVRVVAEPIKTASEATGTAVLLATTELAPHERARVPREKGPIVKERNVSHKEASAWTERRLVFYIETLDRVVEEFNRYNARRLQVIDPELAALQINGNFDANDPHSLVEFLVRTESVDTAVGGDGTVQLFRKKK